MGLYDRLSVYVSEKGRRLIEVIPQRWIDSLPPRIIERSSSYQGGVNQVRTDSDARLRRIVRGSRGAIADVRAVSEAESERLAQQYLVTALRQEGRIGSAQNALATAKDEYRAKLVLFKQHYGRLVGDLRVALSLEGNRLEVAVDARAREVERTLVQQHLVGISELITAYAALEAERNVLERQFRLVRGGLNHKVVEAKELRTRMRDLQKEVDHEIAEAKAELLPSILTAVASTSSQFNNAVCVWLDNRLQPVYATKGFLDFFGMIEQEFGDLSRHGLFQHLDRESLLRVERYIRKQRTSRGRVTVHFGDGTYNLGFKPVPFVANKEFYGAFVVLETSDLGFLKKHAQLKNTRSVVNFLEDIIGTLSSQLRPTT